MESEQKPVAKPVPAATVLLLPRILVRKKDAELYEEAAAPSESFQD